MDDARAKWHHAAQLAISYTRDPARKRCARRGLGCATSGHCGDNKMGEGKLRKSDCSRQVGGIESACAALQGALQRPSSLDRASAAPGLDGAFFPISHDGPRRIGEPGR